MRRHPRRAAMFGESFSSALRAGPGREPDVGAARRPGRWSRSALGAPPRAVLPRALRSALFCASSLLYAKQAFRVCGYWGLSALGVCLQASASRLRTPTHAPNIRRCISLPWALLSICSVDLKGLCPPESDTLTFTPQNPAGVPHVLRTCPSYSPGS